MPHTTIIHVLNQHGMEHKMESGQLLAYEVMTRLVNGHVEPCGDWVDVTGWTANKLYAWLGY